MQESDVDVQAKFIFATSVANVGSATVDPGALSTGNSTMGSETTGATLPNTVLDVSTVLAALLVAILTSALHVLH